MSHQNNTLFSSRGGSTKTSEQQSLCLKQDGLVLPTAVFVAVPTAETTVQKTRQMPSLQNVAGLRTSLPLRFGSSADAALPPTEGEGFGDPAQLATARIWAARRRKGTVFCQHPNDERTITRAETDESPSASPRYHSVTCSSGSPRYHPPGSILVVLKRLARKQV